MLIFSDFDLLGRLFGFFNLALAFLRCCLALSLTLTLGSQFAEWKRPENYTCPILSTKQRAAQHTQQALQTHTRTHVHTQLSNSLWQSKRDKEERERVECFFRSVHRVYRLAAHLFHIRSSTTHPISPCHPFHHSIPSFRRSHDLQATSSRSTLPGLGSHLTDHCVIKLVFAPRPWSCCPDSATPQPHQPDRTELFGTGPPAT